MADVEQTVSIGARVPKDLADSLAAIAKSHDRSTSAEVRRAIRAYVERQDQAA